jgi:hypothetical protein
VNFVFEKDVETEAGAIERAEPLRHYDRTGLDDGAVRIQARLIEGLLMGEGLAVPGPLRKAFEDRAALALSVANARSQASLPRAVLYPMQRWLGLVWFVVKADLRRGS